MTYLLEIEKLTKTYQSGPKRLEVLRHFDLKLEEGEMVAIMGRSGSGKTTLLNCIAGLDKIDSGQITLGGRKLNGLPSTDWDQIRQHDIGIVFQFNQLLPEFTALENVMMPGMLTTNDLVQLEKKARDLLSQMGMADRCDHRPAQMSGGEQQRTAIARSLINSPRLLLADEPTGSLDYASGLEVFDLLQSLQKELKISCLLVTHNPALAQLCARIQAIDEIEPREHS